MAIKLEAGSKASYISKRYIRVVEATTLYQNEDIRLIAIAAGALYKLPRTELIHKEGRLRRLWMMSGRTTSACSMWA